MVFYDDTTLYFETNDEDELRNVGMSKERRVDPQIVVGLLVDRDGVPLEIHCFEGNKAETLTRIPALKSFQNRHQTRDLVDVAEYSKAWRPPDIAIRGQRYCRRGPPAAGVGATTDRPVSDAPSSG